MIPNASFLEIFGVSNVAAPAGAGTTDVNTSAVDMAGWDEVTFAVTFGTAAANNTIKLQQSADSGGSPDDWTDLTNTKVAVGASDETVLVSLAKPAKRYVRAVVLRGTSTTSGDVYAIRGGARSTGSIVNATAGTQAFESHNAPAEGTA